LKKISSTEFDNNSSEKDDLSKAMRTLLRKNIEEWVESEPKMTPEDKTRLIQWQTREYKKLSKYTQVDIGKIVEELVDEKLDA
jgi:hypothetical protein